MHFPVRLVAVVKVAVTGTTAAPAGDAPLLHPLPSGLPPAGENAPARITNYSLDSLNTKTHDKTRFDK